jgi:hypothetical protein
MAGRDVLAPTGATERTVYLGRADAGRRPCGGDDGRHARLRPDGGGRRLDCGRAACPSACPAISAATRRALCLHSASARCGPLTTIGRARAILHVAPSSRVMGVTVSLSDLDRRTGPRTRGQGDAQRHRPELARGTRPLDPGVVEELAIDIDRPRGGSCRPTPARRHRGARTGRNVWPTPEVRHAHRPHGPAPRPRLVLPSCPTKGRRHATVVRAIPVAAAMRGFEPPATWTISEDALTGRVAVHDPARDRASTRPQGTGSNATPAACARWTRGTRRRRSPAAGTAARARSTGHSVRSSADVVLASDPRPTSPDDRPRGTIDDDAPVTRRWVERIPRVLL